MRSLPRKTTETLRISSCRWSRKKKSQLSWKIQGLPLRGLKGTLSSGRSQFIYFCDTCWRFTRDSWRQRRNQSSDQVLLSVTKDKERVMGKGLTFTNSSSPSLSTRSETKTKTASRNISGSSSVRRPSSSSPSRNSSQALPKLLVPSLQNLLHMRSWRTKLRTMSWEFSTGRSSLSPVSSTSSLVSTRKNKCSIASPSQEMKPMSISQLGTRLSKTTWRRKKK